MYKHLLTACNHYRCTEPLSKIRTIITDANRPHNIYKFVGPSCAGKTAPNRAGIWRQRFDPYWGRLGVQHLSISSVTIKIDCLLAIYYGKGLNMQHWEPTLFTSSVSGHNVSAYEPPRTRLVQTCVLIIPYWRNDTSNVNQFWVANPACTSWNVTFAEPQHTRQEKRTDAAYLWKKNVKDFWVQLRTSGLPNTLTHLPYLAATVFVFFCFYGLQI